MSKFTRRRGEQIQEDIQKRERQYRSKRVDEAIERGYSKLYDGDLPGLCTLMRDILMVDLDVSRHTLRRHAERVQDAAADLAWNHEAIRRFVEDPDRYEHGVAASEPDTPGVRASKTYLRAAGMEDPRDRHRQTIVDAFHSLESLAVVTGYVSDSVTNWAPAKGYRLQVGTWYQPPRDDMPHEIQLVDPGDSEEVTVNMGKPGRGKGVVGHTETEDRYASGRKIVDLIDFSENEGGVLDLPNRNPELREVREGMGLPADFTDHDDYDRPNLEIMVPLTNGLGNKAIPYYGDGATDTVVRPFTVPASSLSKRALKRFVSAELTKVQVNIFEAAYDRIQRHESDWNLRDLIRAVEKQRGEHGNQGAVDRVQRAVSRVQKKGWIRDESDPNCISWERILTSPETITVFTASLMSDKDEAAQYLFHAYLLYALRVELKRLKAMPDGKKDGWRHVPKVTTILRELHKIAPNSETAVDDPTIREVQDAMTGDFRDLTAMHRHEGVEILADTQNFIGEIKKRARKNFNRACLFQVNLSDAVEMFREISGTTNDQYAKTVTRRFGVGECAVLGRVGTDRPFEMTISVAPPMSHHFDPDEWYNPETGMTVDNEELKDRLGGEDPARANPEGWRSVNSGWDLRVYLGGEEYRPARELLDADGATEMDGAPDLETVRREASDMRPDSGPGQFAWDCLEVEPNGQVILDRLEAAYYSYAEANGHSERWDSRSPLFQQIGNTPTPEDHATTFSEEWHKRKPVIHEWEDGKRQTRIYQGVKFTDLGEGHAPGMDEGPDADANPRDDAAESGSDGSADGDDGDSADGDGDTAGADPDGEDEPATEDDSADLGSGAVATTATIPDVSHVVDDLGEDDTTDVDSEESHSEPSDASDSDVADPDVACGCPDPEPVPMYAGERQEEQVGWTCRTCGKKEWNR